MKLGAEWDNPAPLGVCSLSRLWVGREISWCRGHKVSLVKICAVDTDGVNRNEGIYIMLKSTSTSILSCFLQIRYKVIV